MIKLTFSETGRSLFKKDRLTYSLHFVKGVFPQLFAKNEWEFFSGASIIESRSNARLPNWASKDRAEIFGMFATTHQMLVQQLQLDNEGIWSDFGSHPQAEQFFPQ